MVVEYLPEPELKEIDNWMVDYDIKVISGQKPEPPSNIE